MRNNFFTKSNRSASLFKKHAAITENNGMSLNENAFYKTILWKHPAFICQIIRNLAKTKM